jgi:HrpA-like RNA helicase
MDRVDETILNYDLIEDVLELLFSHSNTFTTTDNVEVKNGAVLIFLPGLREIRTLMDRLSGRTIFRNNDKLEVIPLHSSLSSKDQRRAFKPANKGCRKIIISTNIAETSVTIPDVTCIIDSGLVREIQRDQRTGTQKLVTTWCSKANTKQRCGRAGRVQPGISLRLFSSKTEALMKSVTDPELKRIPLEEVCLTILASGLSTSCKSFLANAPEPPLVSAIDVSLEELRCIGAISIEKPDGISSDGPREELTALGEHLTKIPIDARLGKMLIYGTMFQCLDPALTLAACLSASQTPFVLSILDGEEVKAAHSSFLDTSSDFVTLLNVWEGFVSAGSAARRFCREKYLNYNAFLEIADARDQFLSHLCIIGFVDRKVLLDGQRNYKLQSKSPDVIHFVICAGLYPNVAKMESDLGLVHKTEQVSIHNSSVNAKSLKDRPSDWVAFHEKLGTGRQITISTTCFVHPFSLFLLGPMIHIEHILREVEIDNWIKLTLSGKTAVLLKGLKHRLERSLKNYIQQVNDDSNVFDVKVIDKIISILCQV